jgi:hypothetical protein
VKGKGRTQGKGFGYVMAVPVAVLLIVAAMTVYDYRNASFKSAHANARTETYFAEQSGSFCVMEGVWHNWEDDETITLGCLEVRGNIREGSYSSATGPRATSDFSMSGTYDLDSDSSMQVVGKDQYGQNVKFITPFYVDDTEYPTQMIVIDKMGGKNLYIWKRKE